jgi:uncharacterized protein (DUF924 family)
LTIELAITISQNLCLACTEEQLNVNEFHYKVIELVLDFWFKEVAPKQWWRKDAAFDALIQGRFFELHQRIKEGRYLDWMEHSKGCLARVIVLDQFSRNMFRDTPLAFETDSLAISCSKYAIRHGYDISMRADEKAFLYMPFMHSEVLNDQIQSQALFSQEGLETSLESASRHHDIITEFGRFPHRNQILGRVSTVAELNFLRQPGSSF